MVDRVVKDPDAVLDYRFDWAAETNGIGLSDWLDVDGGETITSHTIDADLGITVDSSNTASSNTAVVVWLSGGTDGQEYEVRCEIVTSDGRTDERSMLIVCRER